MQTKDTFSKQLKRSPFKDITGKVVLVQWPNWSLWCIILINLLMRIDFGDEIVNGLRVANFALLIIWAYEEMVRGSSLFRRILGLVIVGFTLINLSALIK